MAVDMESSVRKVVSNVVKASGLSGLEAMVAVDTVVAEALEWPVWYYEQFGEVRPSFKYKNVADVLKAYGSDPGSDVIRKLVDESGGIPVGDEEAVSAVLERVLFFSGWVSEFLEDAYGGYLADEDQVTMAVYGSPYGDDD